MSDWLARVIETVNWPSLFGSPAESSLASMEINASSLSAIKTVAAFALVSIVAWALLVPTSVRTTLSDSSNTKSSITSTLTTAVVCPARIVTAVGIDT